MLQEETYEVSLKSIISGKISDYVVFTKFRLASLVVFSSGIGYLIASTSPIDWYKFWWLILGGFLVIASSGGLNQIIERDSDKLMSRTADRPLPQNRMNLTEAYIVAFLMGIAGITVLWVKTNTLCATLSFISWVLYAFVYTPLKKKTPWAVFVGAIPGAMSPMLGYIAAGAGDKIEFYAWLLFAIQFIWQFPHFWAIAWVADDDYKKAGFRLLPSAGGRDKTSAFLVLVFTFFLVPFGMLSGFFGMNGTISGIVIITCGMAFAYQAYKLYNECTVKAAKRLMFGSFIYLPVVQLAILFGKN
ncbi:MAG TPA: heme o synthase [Bacteroidia bacterium]|nr:heme o synthase [Bacteroidia bacterium]